MTAAVSEEFLHTLHRLLQVSMCLAPALTLKLLYHTIDGEQDAMCLPGWKKWNQSTEWKNEKAPNGCPLKCWWQFMIWNCISMGQKKQQYQAGMGEQTKTSLFTLSMVLKEGGLRVLCVSYMLPFTFPEGQGSLSLEVLDEGVRFCKRTITSQSIEASCCHW